MVKLFCHFVKTKLFCYNSCYKVTRSRSEYSTVKVTTAITFGEGEGFGIEKGLMGNSWAVILVLFLDPVGSYTGM